MEGLRPIHHRAVGRVVHDNAGIIARQTYRPMQNDTR